MVHYFAGDERWRSISFLSVVALVFTLPWRSMVTVEVLGRQTSFFVFVVPIVALVWLVEVLRSERMKSITRFHLYYFLFLAWSLLSIAWSIDAIDSLKDVITLLMVGLLLVLVWDVVCKTWQLDRLLQAFVFGCTLPVLSILWNYITHNPYGRHESQYSAIGYNPNDLSIIIAFSIGIAYYFLLCSESRSKWLKYYNLVFILASTTAVILTGSRQGFVFLLFASLYGATSVFVQIPVKRWHIFVGSLLAIIVGFQIIPHETLGEIATIPQVILKLDDIRFQIWGAAIEAIQNRPLVGYGIGVHQLAYDAFPNPTENGVLGILGNLGIVGLLLFTLMMLTSIRQLSNTDKYLSLWLCLFALLFLQSLVNNVMLFSTTYLIPNFVILSAAITE